jgi:hypothetical protein
MLGEDRSSDQSSPRPSISPKSKPPCFSFSRFPSPPPIPIIPSSQHQPVLSTHHRTVHQALSPHTTAHNLNRTSSTSLQPHVSCSSISPVSISHTTHSLNSTSSTLLQPHALCSSISPLPVSVSLSPSHARFISSFSNPSFSRISSSNPSFSARNARLVNTSPYRPPVAASQRLTTWSSPFAQRHRSSLESSLPPALINIAYRTVRCALAPSTQTVYGAGLLRFMQFCDSWRISEEARMPASQELLVAFVAQCTGLYGGNTIRSWLSGIRSWHLLNGACWVGDSDWLHLARTAANKSGTSFKRPLRAPVSVEHLHILHRKLDLTTPFHAAVWAVALITFFGCRRLGTPSLPVSFSPFFSDLVLQVRPL